MKRKVFILVLALSVACTLPSCEKDGPINNDNGQIEQPDKPDVKPDKPDVNPDGPDSNTLPVIGLEVPEGAYAGENFEILGEGFPTDSKIIIKLLSNPGDGIELSTSATSAGLACTIPSDTPAGKYSITLVSGTDSWVISENFNISIFGNYAKKRITRIQIYLHNQGKYDARTIHFKYSDSTSMLASKIKDNQPLLMDSNAPEYVFDIKANNGSIEGMNLASNLISNDLKKFEYKPISEGKFEYRYWRKKEVENPNLEDIYYNLSYSKGFPEYNRVPADDRNRFNKISAVRTGDNPNNPYGADAYNIVIECIRTTEMGMQAYSWLPFMYWSGIGNYEGKSTKMPTEIDLVDVPSTDLIPKPTNRTIKNITYTYNEGYVVSIKYPSRDGSISVDLTYKDVEE